MLPQTPGSWCRAYATIPGSPAPHSIPCARCRRIAATAEKVCFWISCRRAMPVETCLISSSNDWLVLVKFGGTAKGFNVVPIFPGLFLAHFVLGFFQVFSCPVRTVLIDRGFELAY